MTLVAVPPTPLWEPLFRGTTTHTSSTLNAADEKAALVFQAPEDGNIDRLDFMITAVVAAEAALKVRLETVDTNGQPSGSLAGTNTETTINANSTGWKEATLTAAASVTKGQWLALVVALPPGSTGNISIGLSTAPTAMSRPYSAIFTTSWNKNARTMAAAVRYDDGTYPFIPGVLPLESIGNSSFNSSSTPDERGSKITVPFACRVWGAWLAGHTQDGDFNLKLYDDADGVLASLSIDGNFHVDGTSNYEYIAFDGEVDLAAGDMVRVTVTATTATNTQVPEMTAPSGLGSALPGGSNMIKTTRSDGGAWTDTADTMPLCGLVISALDDGAGGGGGTTQGNLGSVLRGVAH